jgi:hypothetical protein
VCIERFTRSAADGKLRSVDAASHEATYRSLPLILGGLLGSFALMFAGIAGALLLAARDQRFPLVLVALGVFVLVFAVCALWALRRHRWTIGADAVLIEERPLVPMPLLPIMGRRRVRRVPFGQIASLNNVSNGPDELLALTTRAGERFVLPPVRIKGDGPIPWPDQVALAAFATQLQAAMTAAGVAAPLVTDGLGFWNRPPGLALLGVTFLASLALAAVVLWALWEGANVRARTHEAAALLVALPILIGWLLRRSWRRRQSVMRAMSRP